MKYQFFILIFTTILASCGNPNVDTSIPKPENWYEMLGHHKDQIKYWMENNNTFTLQSESDSVLVYKGKSVNQEWVVTLHDTNSVIDQITHSTKYLLQYPSFGTYGDIMTEWITTLRRNGFRERSEEKSRKEGYDTVYLQEMENTSKGYLASAFMFWNNYTKEGNVSLLFTRYEK